MNIEGWTRKSLGSFTQFIKGITYASEDYCKEDEGAIFLTIKCVSKSGGFKLEGIKYYRGIIHENEKLKEGDILISNTDLTRDGDIVGCPIMVPFLGTNEVTMSMDLSKLVIDSFQIDSKFLYYKLMTDKVRRFMQDHASGSTVLHLQTKAVPTLELLIPDKKEEQEKIAEILSTIDRAIAQTEAIIAKQQRIKTGLMQDLLTKGIDENGNIRSEATHKFKDSAIGRIPVEWKVVATGEVTNSLVPGRDKPDLDGGGIPWITIPDIDAMYICASKNGFSLSQKAIKLANARLMPRGTVLMSCVGEFGITTITEVEVIANQQLHGFICGDDILPEWLAIQINASGTRIDTLTTQTTIKYLNKTGCESILIALPNIDEQKRAISIFGNSLRFIATQEKHLAKLQHQKTGLMQGLLTGKVRVTNLLKEREPTSP
jgi:type I restriction enzyme S subunit